MSHKLIATNFDYRYVGVMEKTQRGSYLGRTIASRATIRRFLRRNERTCGLDRKLDSVTITGSYVSQWIAK